MGEIIPFRGRTSETNVDEAIQDALQSQGFAVQSIESLTVSLDEWRKRARSVARKLGRPVQTIVVGDSVHAALRDWPRDEREQLLHDQAKRAIVEGAATYFLEKLPPFP